MVEEMLTETETEEEYVPMRPSSPFAAGPAMKALVLDMLIRVIQDYLATVYAGEDDPEPLGFVYHLVQEYNFCRFEAGTMDLRPESKAEWEEVRTLWDRGLECDPESEELKEDYARWARRKEKKAILAELIEERRQAKAREAAAVA